MEDQYLSTVFLLAGRGSVKVLPKCCFNPDTVPKKLLRGRKKKKNFHKFCSYSEHVAALKIQVYSHILLVAM